MWCKTCGYALDGLSVQRCPECGREFDLTNRRSFARRLPGVPFLLTVASSISMILFFVVVFIWIWTPDVGFVFHRGGFDAPGGKYGESAVVTSYDGVISCSIDWNTQIRVDVRWRPARGRDVTYLRGSNWWNRMGFHAHSPWVAAFPLWFLAVITAVMPLLWLFRYRRARRMRYHR
jgi:hypothetical protein